MASKINVTPPKAEMLDKEGPETPLLDLSDVAVQETIDSAKKRGYVTHDEINALLSSKELKSEQIENASAKFSAMGLNVVQTKEEAGLEQPARGEPEEETASENELVEIQQRSVPYPIASVKNRRPRVYPGRGPLEGGTR